MKNVNNWKGKLLLSHPCPTCKVPIGVYEDLEYGPNSVRDEEGTEMCDYGTSDGCMETYHAGACFDSHRCPAHEPHVPPCSLCGLHHEELTPEQMAKHTPDEIKKEVDKRAQERNRK